MRSGHVPCPRRARVSGDPRVSVFTPSHQPRYLDECFRSLRAQTFEDWEWVVVLNQGARWRPPEPDPRVRVEVKDDLVGVGAAKRHACAVARGEFLVELDHDDILRIGRPGARGRGLRRPPRGRIRLQPVRPDQRGRLPRRHPLRRAQRLDLSRSQGRRARRAPVRLHGGLPAQRELHLVRAEPRAGLPPRPL